MDPVTLAALFAGGSLLSGLGSGISGAQPYQDTTQNWLKQFNSQQGFSQGNRDLNYGNSNKLLQALYGAGSLNPQSYLEKATGYSNNSADIYNQIKSGYSPGGAYTAGGMQGTFAGLNPQLQSLAGGVAQDATSRAGTSMEGLAQAASSRNLNKMQNSMGAQGLFGAAAGPAAASLSYGAQEPLMQAQTAINQMYNNSYMGAYNPMSQFTMGNIQSEPGNMANIGQLYAQLSNQQYGAASPLLQLLGGLSEQAILAPDLQQKSSALGGMLSGLGNAGAQLGMFGLGQGWNGKALGSNGAGTPMTQGSTGIPRWLNF